MWFKYRTGSSARNSDWRFKFISDSYMAKMSPKNKREELARIFEEDCNANTQSEHYRGVEWVRVDIANIPSEVIQGKLDSAKNLLKAYKSSVKFYEDEIKKCKVKEIHKRCKSCKGKGKVNYPNTGLRDCVYCSGTGKVKDYDTW